MHYLLIRTTYFIALTLFSLMVGQEAIAQEMVKVSGKANVKVNLSANGDVGPEISWYVDRKLVTKGNPVDILVERNKVYEVVCWPKGWEPQLQHWQGTDKKKEGARIAFFFMKGARNNSIPDPLPEFPEGGISDILQMGSTPPPGGQERPGSGAHSNLVSSAREGWALVVGVSKYQDSSLDLGYAASDASNFYKWLVSPTGGGYSKDKVTILLNEDATLKEMRSAVRDLEKSLPEEMAIVYVSGHGAPEDELSDVLYFLPHDADADNLAETGYKMSNFMADLKDYVSADNMILFMDACHSGGMGKVYGRDSTRQGRALKVVEKTKKEMVSRVNSGVSGLATKGVFLMTASREDQVSWEDSRFNGGVFTHFLLRGLEGAADSSTRDQPTDGLITISELANYVSAEVQRETKRKQHPRTSGDYEPRATISLQRAAK
jgi:uncharacterized caspase-like protein